MSSMEGAATTGSSRISSTPSSSEDGSSKGARVVRDIKQAGASLRSGGLVAFPTETVYGLGANAYDDAAVRRIFQVKGRPLTDPLIAHVASPSDAWALFGCSGEGGEGGLLKALGERFWPGPLTLVAPAAKDIPGAVTAGTGWVGVRCPRHALARRLIAEAGVPVVAPSANRFGHVSPISSSHVMADLGEHGIMVLHEQAGDKPWGEEEKGQQLDDKLATCEIGIESTVAKVDYAAMTITILRAGAVTPSELLGFLATTSYSDINVSTLSRPEGGPVLQAEDDQTPQMAPGQCIRHYAPDVPTFLMTRSDASTPWAAQLAALAVVLDIGGRLSPLKAVCKAYRDLSPEGDVREAAAGLFDGLRWAEIEAGAHSANTVLLPEIRDEPSIETSVQQLGDKEFALAVADRLLRAASGRSAVEATVKEVVTS